MLLQLLSIKIVMVALSTFEKCDIILGERVLTCDNPCVKRSDIDAILDLIDILGWKSVALIYDNNTGASTLNLFLDGFSYRNVLLSILEQDNSTNVTARTITHVSNFILLGSTRLVRQTFQEVTMFAHSRKRVSLPFDTEWLVLIEHKDIFQAKDDNNIYINEVAGDFQNVAVVSHTKEGGSLLWTVKHMQDKNQMIFVTSLPVCPGSLTRSKIFQKFISGLDGRTLRIVVEENSYIFKRIELGKTVYQGILMDVLHELSIRLNFRYELMEPLDDSWGQELDNGHWDGPVGMLIRNEVDMAVGYFTLTEQRSLVVDATHAFTHDNWIIVFRKPQYRADVWDFYLQPYQACVFIAIFSCFGGTILLVVLLEIFEQDINKEMPLSATEARKRGNWNCIFKTVLNGFLNKIFGIQTESRCGRILVCSWLMFSVVFASLYSSKLTSSLTISDQSLPFTSLSELVNQNVYTWGMRAGTASEAMVKNSTNEDYKKFYNGLLAFARKDPSVRSPDDNVHLAKVMGGNYAYFAGNELFCQANMTACSDLAFIRDDNFRVMKVFYLQKGSPYTKIISIEINRMVDMGLISFWKRRWLENTLPRFQTENVGQIAKPIMLAETQSAFYIAGAGVVLGALTLGLECCLVLFKARSKR